MNKRTVNRAVVDHDGAEDIDSYGVLTKQVTQHFENEVESLDPTVTNQLSVIRRQALAQADVKPSRLGSTLKDFLSTGWLTPAMGVTAAVLVGVLVINGNPTPDSSSEPTAVASTSGSASLIEDVQLLSANEDLDFFMNLELLEWMENNAS